MFCQKCGKKLNENAVCENCYPSHINSNDSETSNNNSTKQKVTFDEIFDKTASNTAKPKNKTTSNDDELRDANKISKAEMMSFVGDENSDYFIKKWTKSQKNKNFLSLNLAAFFTNFFWFWYRKMYCTAIIIFFVSAIFIALTACFAIVILAPIASDYLPYVSEHKWISLLICLLIPLSVSLKANQLYIKHAAKKINKIKSKKSPELDNDAFLKRLRSKGGTTLMPLFCIIGILIILLIYILIVIEPSIIVKSVNYVLKFTRKLF